VNLFKYFLNIKLKDGSFKLEKVLLGPNPKKINLNK
jgi:hypothetical protein